MPRANSRHTPGNSVAIVGGGFTGSMLAVQLLRQSGGRVSVVLVERGEEPGLGVAYGTEFHGHLLNVRARNMSAYADDPEHFVRWAQAHYSPLAQADDYLPRAVYGRYVRAQFQETAQDYPEQLRCIQGEAAAVALHGQSATVSLASGETVAADKVVLALGNFPPSDLAIPGKTPDSKRFVSNPWSRQWLDHAGEDTSVLLIGSGLTSVDVTVELRARGLHGTIHVLSRRGQMPQRHMHVDALTTPRLEEVPRTVRGLLRWMRRQTRAAEEQGLTWRSVVDALRPINQQIWQSLSRPERRRFLRHGRAYWDVHRHRIAGAIADQLADESARGQLQVHAGRLTEYAEDASGVTVAYRERGSGEVRQLRVDRVINCTGPDGDFRRVESPLVTDLLQQGLGRPDELLLGLDVADDGALLDGQGKPSSCLFALGPLRKGSLWESIAVPELRVQIAELAELLAAQQPAEAAEPAELAASHRA